MIWSGQEMLLNPIPDSGINNKKLGNNVPIS